ncbi:MAG: YggT family protein [Thermoleophilaceae bacterium]|nr:YggT family protein [Thermoleophilaceae bacterium]
MTFLLAVTRQDVADYLYTLIIVYVVLIFIRIVLSWIPRVPYNRFLAAGIGFVTDVTDPYLNMFRKILPPVKLGPGALDLSPMVGTFVLLIFGGIIVNIIGG